MIIYQRELISFSAKKSVILHRNPHSGLVQAHIGSDGTDDTVSRLLLVEETRVGIGARAATALCRVHHSAPLPWPIPGDRPGLRPAH